MLCNVRACPDEASCCNVRMVWGQDQGRTDTQDEPEAIRCLVRGTRPPPPDQTGCWGPGSGVSGYGAAALIVVPALMCMATTICRSSKSTTARRLSVTRRSPSGRRGAREALDRQCVAVALTIATGQAREDLPGESGPAAPPGSHDQAPHRRPRHPHHQRQKRPATTRTGTRPHPQLPTHQQPLTCLRRPDKSQRADEGTRTLDLLHGKQTL